MSRMFIVMAIVAVLLAAGCSAKSRMLDQKEPSAIAQTVSQAQADLSCPQVTARVFSRDMVMEPVPSARYGIGVTGCGKEAMYTVTCQEFGEDYRECIISAPGEP